MKENLRGMRETGLLITADIVSQQFKHFAQQWPNDDLLHIAFCLSWCRAFVREYLNWCFRRATAAAQKLPSMWKSIKEDFIRRVTAVFLVEVQELAFVVNLDHTGVRLVPCGNYTYEECGRRDIKEVSIDDKRQVTVLLGSAADGCMLPPQVIYAGTTDGCLPPKQFTDPCTDLGWNFTFTANHWASMDTTKQALEQLLQNWYQQRCIQLGKEPGQQKMILLVDCWAVHCSREFRSWVARNFPWIILLFVPPNMTSVCQPADTGLQKPFKDGIKLGYNRWLAERYNNNPDERKVPLGMRAIKGPSLGWMLDSWLNLAAQPSMVLSAWAAAGLDSLSNPVFQEAVRREGMLRYLQEQRPEPERELNIEVAMDVADLEPDDVPDQKAEAEVAEAEHNKANQEREAMLDMAKASLAEQLKLLPAHKGTVVRRRGRGVTFELDSEGSSEAPAAEKNPPARTTAPPLGSPGAGPSRPSGAERSPPPLAVAAPVVPVKAPAPGATGLVTAGAGPSHPADSPDSPSPPVVESQESSHPDLDLAYDRDYKAPLNDPRIKYW